MLQQFKYFAHWTRRSYRENLAIRKFWSRYKFSKLKAFFFPIFQGDYVEITDGDEKGKRGKVICIHRKINHVYVRGLNLKKDSIQYKDRDYNYEYEEPFTYNQVKLIDPKDKKATRVMLASINDGKTLVRISENSGNIIPIEAEGDFLLNGPYAYQPQYVNGPLDTSTKEVFKQTYQPSLMTFEEEIFKANESWFMDMLRETDWKNRDYTPLPKQSIIKLPKRPPPFTLPHLEEVKIENKDYLHRISKKPEKLTEIQS